MSRLYIGIMSGTSLDGIDLALCKIDSTKCELLHSYEHPFSTPLKEEILEIIHSTTTLKKIGELDMKLGLHYVEAIEEFFSSTLQGYTSADIEAIGLHGQTLWHEPHSEYPFSMQLGSASVVRSKSGIKVVNDFRSIDVANGGEGAPFAPAFHKFLFGDMQRNVGVLNIGGMANITLLHQTQLLGWDSGCGNVLLDMHISKSQNLPYDRDGTFAKSGNVIEELLRVMLADEYFTKEPPKSTGREYFNASWLKKKLKGFKNLKSEDIQRTLLELSAKSIANDLKTTEVELLIVCGGGSKNSFLMQRLQELTQIEVQKSDTFGVSSDFLEAMAFAWLAHKRIVKEVVELSSVTGAKKNSILGALYE